MVLQVGELYVENRWFYLSVAVLRISISHAMRKHPRSNDNDNQKCRESILSLDELIVKSRVRL